MFQTVYLTVVLCQSYYKMIANIVATTSLGIDINLRDTLRLSVPGVSYNPRKFAAAVLRFKQPKCTMLVFSNGKVVCNGSNNQPNMSKNVKRLVRKLKKIGYTRASATPLIIANVVASSEMNSRLDLTAFCKQQQGVQYNTEIFPGASFDIGDGVKAVAFSTGKFYCTGSKSEEQAMIKLNEVKQQLLSYVL